jgi:glycyl-tRNA synthetase
VTIDYDTKDTDSVTLRDRDTMTQVRIPVAELIETVSALVKGRITFASLLP